MRILGIDPGTARVGFGIIDVDSAHDLKFVQCGMVTTSKEQADHERLKEIYSDIEGIIAEQKPQKLAIEKLYFQTNTTTAMTVGQARGVLLLAAARHNLEVQEFTPLEIKQAITGYGKAEKAQVQDMVTKILKLDFVPKPDDVADALAVAITATNKNTAYA